MNAGIEIRKTSDGRIQARRLDGKPLTTEDRVDARRMAVIKDLPARAWVAEEIRNGNSLRAVKICSSVLEDHLWLILDGRFEPKDSLAIYYPEELPELKTKTPEQLQEIHRAKLAFPRSRVIQEGTEA